METVKEARDVHAQEQGFTLRSTLLVGKLESLRASLAMGMSSARFAPSIGLTADQYWKRAQAARVMAFHPRSKAMVEAGETHVSHLAVIASKITQANCDLILDGMRNKSKREVVRFVACVTPDGRVIGSEVETELRLNLTMAQLGRIERAREVLSRSSSGPSMAAVILQAIAELLERRDPMEKAARGEKRKALLATPTQGEADREGEHAPTLAAPAQGEVQRFPKPLRRTAVPRGLRHAVWNHDQGVLRMAECGRAIFNYS